jgi:hypothetical protein
MDNHSTAPNSPRPVPLASRTTSGDAPRDGVCARSGRPYRSGDFVDYVPGLGFVLQELDAALDPGAILFVLGFDTPDKLRDLQLTVADLQRRNPERLKTLGRIMGEYLVHGTTHHTGPAAP